MHPFVIFFVTCDDLVTRLVVKFPPGKKEKVKKISLARKGGTNAVTIPVIRTRSISINTLKQRGANNSTV